MQYNVYISSNIDHFFVVKTFKICCFSFVGCTVGHHFYSLLPLKWHTRHPCPISLEPSTHQSHFSHPPPQHSQPLWITPWYSGSRSSTVLDSTWLRSCYACLSVPGSNHLIQWALVPHTWSQVTAFHCFNGWIISHLLYVHFFHPTTQWWTFSYFQFLPIMSGAAVHIEMLASL